MLFKCCTLNDRFCQKILIIICYTSDLIVAMYNAVLQHSMLIEIKSETLHQYQPIETNQDFNKDCSLNILQLVGANMPPIRNRIASTISVPNAGNNATQNCYSQIMPCPQTPNYQKSPNNKGYVKRNHYNHNSNRNRDIRYGRQRPQSLDTSSDSGIDSRSSTPGLISARCDQIQNDEFADESFSSEYKGMKRLHEVNGSSQSPLCYTQNVHSYHPNHSHNGTYYPRRSESPNQGYKRRYHNVGDRHFMPNFGAPIRGRRITGMFLNQQDSHSTLNFLPDHFLTHAHLIETKQPLVHLRTGSKWDDLSTSIWVKFVENQQTTDMYKNKMQLWKNILTFIKSSLPRYHLYLVGSTMSGFSSNNSDVDMCLVVRPAEVDQRNEAPMHLSYVRRLLLQWDYVEKLELIQAKVPILKFRDVKQHLEVDLNCNNLVGIRNTHLLYCYSKLDWRVRPLVLVVKLWAHINNINDAKNMTISSYSLTLMVIHFLQCGISPAVLPCLQKLYRDKFLPDSDIQEIDIHEDLPTPPSENEQTLGELLLHFFGYYNNFNFNQDAISVRLGSKIKIEDCRRAQTIKNEPHQWKYLCIEEPFEQTNTARSVYDPDVFNQIRTVFRTSFKRLKDTLRLESIFNLHVAITKTSR